MMKQIYFYFSALVLLILLNACNIFNPAEPVPSFIHIQNITLSTDSTTEGTNSSKITDAWVYIDNELVGCYELPVTLPVLQEGTHDLTVKAGIKVNGIGATRAPYPFYKEYKEIITLSRGNTLTVKPAVIYDPNINWSSIEVWKENFDGTDIGIDSLSTSTSRMVHYTIPPNTSDPLVFEGIGSGVAYIDNDHPLFEGVSYTPFILPHGDSPVFLELNYKSNGDFVVGIFAHVSGSSVKTKVINVRASPEWNKIYVYLSPAINANGNASAYSVFFGMPNVSGSNGLYMALDNIKLVHY